MAKDPDHPALHALFRMVEARLSVSAIGVYHLRPDACKLHTATRALRQRIGGNGIEGWHPIDPSVASALATGEPTVMDAGELGFAGGFVAARALPGQDGVTRFLMIHDARQRRLTDSMVGALNDGAALLEALVPAAADQTGRADMPDGAEAHRAIENLLRSPSTTGEKALFVINLDRFRAVNEALGAAAGDALLAVTGARIERALEDTDLLRRLEGDRFVILATSPPKDLLTFARQLQDIIVQPLVLAGKTIAVHASIGIVRAGAGDSNARSLLARAENAMRRAQSEGRDGCAIHEARIDGAILDKSRMELDLSNAVLNGQLHLAYQPFVDLQSGDVAGVEALLRWHHPTRGDVQPNIFIPLAESTGLILPLGIWTLETACREAAHWPTPLTLAVNISALQFHQPDFTAQVDAVLAKTGFPAARLELEITETVLMRDNPETIHQLRALIARGIRIALDDFGTGYSALAYLARLPHHRIKLDKSFVQDLGNPGTADLIRAIVAQARASHVNITAEGVERPEMIGQVRAMGFTHAQGYATGTPTAFPDKLFGIQLVAS